MLQIGKKAPNFSAKNQNNQIISLKDFIGKKVAIYFYPKDDTPTCTTQACNIRDNFQLLKTHQIEVIGISVDDVVKHKKFETKYQLPFQLIADVDKKIVNLYEVWGEKLFMGKIVIGTLRHTFLINEKGKLIGIINPVKSKIHSQQILNGFGLNL